MRTVLSIAVTAALMASPGHAFQDKATAPGPSIAGGWTRNADLSDASPARGQQGDDAAARRGGRGDGGGGHRPGGRGGGGGFGGGGFGRGGGMGRGGGTAANPDEVGRVREAMRDVTNPSDHLIITQTESMIVVTGADGRTIRLSPDGKKIKDENTKVERKTKWDGEKLVSEISGLGPGKMTQTFSRDPEGKQLRVTVLIERGGSGQPRTITQVYDLDPR